MAKLKVPDDLLRLHSRIKDRVLWLETHISGEPTEHASLVAHINDIVEHLFRGSEQAHTGAAPFGHLASHFWESEHDDPSLKRNWEFHRKMRVLRERVGANRPIVDVFGSGVAGTNRGGSATSGPGYFYNTKTGIKRKPMAFTEPSDPHILVNTSGGIYQEFMIPGDPSRYASHFSVVYFRPEFNAEGPPPEHFGEFGPAENPDGPSPSLQAASEGPGQEITETQFSADEAVNVAFFAETLQRGGGIAFRSERWQRVNEELEEHRLPQYHFSPVTRPSPALEDGNHRHPVPSALTSVGGMPEDAFFWADRSSEFVISLYPDGFGPIGSEIAKSQLKLWVKDGREDMQHCGVYGGMWYKCLVHEETYKGEKLGYNVFSGRPDWEKGVMYLYIPAEFIQSPGPPVDFDLSQEPTKYEYAAEGALPEGSCVSGSRQVVEDTKRPHRTFEEAITIFEEIKNEPLFKELLEFWTRHLEDFNRSGSAFNHGWVQAEQTPITPLTGANPEGVKVEFLKRYGYCHLRGRLRFNLTNYSFGTKTAWEFGQESLVSGKNVPDPTLYEGGEGKESPFTGASHDFICNSNIGPVRVRIKAEAIAGTREPTQLVFPDLGSNFGLGSPSNLAWIDLDGISYPHE